MCIDLVNFVFVEIFRHRSLKISSKQGRRSKLSQV